jgi:inosose dehydratase
MRIVVHHHAGTFVETPEEIARLLSATEVDLLLDTGHCVYGGGDPLDLLQRHPTRIRYLHYKDIDVDKLAWIRTESIDMDRAWRANVFVPLGQGSIDFPSITNYLRGCEYKGWIIVEQDVVLGDDGEAPFDLLECAKQSRTYLKGLGL